MNPALCRDQKESREKVSLQHKDEKKKKISWQFLSFLSHFLHTFSLFLTHSYSFLHTNPQTCQTKNKTVEHAEKNHAVRNISENNVIFLNSISVQN